MICRKCGDDKHPQLFVAKERTKANPMCMKCQREIRDRYRPEPTGRPVGSAWRPRGHSRLRLPRSI